MSKTVILLPGGKHTTADGIVHDVNSEFEVTDQEFELWQSRFALVNRAGVVSSADVNKLSADDSVMKIDGVGKATADKLNGAGVVTIGDLLAADSLALAEKAGLSTDNINAWKKAVLEA